MVDKPNLFQNVTLYNRRFKYLGGTPKTNRLIKCAKGS